MEINPRVDILASHTLVEGRRGQIKENFRTFVTIEGEE